MEVVEHPHASAVNKFMHNEDVEGSAIVPASAYEFSDNNDSNSSCIEDASDGVCEGEYSDEESDYMFDSDDDDDDDVSDYDNDEDDDYMPEYDNDDDDSDYLKLQAQFDSIDLPAGVEADVPWLNNPTPSSTVATSVSAPQDCSSAQPAGTNIEPSASSSSAGQSCSGKCDDQDGDGDGNEVIRKYRHFKNFDLADDPSDHYYYNMNILGQRPKAWLKKIQDDWEILKNGLPDSIYVRVYETRMDLLRAVIVGAQGTPYHDALFVFDAFYPHTYPDKPPMVYYYSGGLRLNPNLYPRGNVCLSLLNPWLGETHENWQPKISTMLQVLVSIQALVLNAKPFFNQPGYESVSVSVEREQMSKVYNEQVFVLSLKTMLYTLQKASTVFQNFKDLVIGHFQTHAHDILSACKAYMEGAVVGSVAKGEIQVSGGSEKFKGDVSKMVNDLISIFTENGAKDCDKFRLTS